MRKFKKILKWTGIILFFLVSGIFVTVMTRQNMKYDRPFPAIAASTDSSVIAKGKHIVFGGGHCASCHSLSNSDSLLALGEDVALSGGFVFDLPFGKIYTKNLTSDKETGIGNYTDAELARSLRYGVHPDGSMLYPFMPFNNLSDDDLTAVISYLRTQKPVRNPVPDHELNVLGKVLKAFVLKPVGPVGEVPKSVKEEATPEYGRYLATYVANCNGCHTERNSTGSFVGVPFAGGAPMEDPAGTHIPPNLTPDSTSRIFGWSEENFINRFRLGAVQKGSHMPWNSYKRMSDTELKAIYAFLRSLPPSKSKVWPTEHK